MGVSKVLRKISSRGAKCSAVVVAAGKATRMEGTDKIMAELCGEPLIVHTLRAFQNAQDVVEIVLVTREELLEPLSRLVVEKKLSKVKRLCKGGESRAESVRIGLDYVGKDCDLVAIHDAIRKAEKFGAAAPAVPVKDTIKEVHGGIIEATPDRSALYAVQTPQVFKTAVYRAALEAAIGGKKPLTDDCSAAEAYGVNVIITPGSDENFKVTTPTDLLLAEAVLKARADK